MALAREVERRRRQAERDRAAADKEQKRQHVERRRADSDAENMRLAAKLDELRTVLVRCVSRSARIDPRSLLRAHGIPPLQLGELAEPIRPPEWDTFAPHEPGFVARTFGGKGRHERKLAEARFAFGEAHRASTDAEVARQMRVVAARAEHDERVRQAENAARAYNETIDALGRDLASRKKGAVEWHVGEVLKRVPLPDHFPRVTDVAFSPQNEQVVIQFELPSRDRIPDISGYQYLSTKDEVRATASKPKEIADLYRAVISQVALSIIRDVFDADPRLVSVGFNGHVHATNPGTGQREYPCIISLNVEREDFPADLELRQVTPEVCVRHLKAIVSNHPYDLEAIEPILDFDLTKYSFVEGLDAVATLDSRPDLLQMSATNFEHLVRQLFEAQGLTGWTTQQSNDDGVDAVIVNKTSIVGGLAIVQAKRWSIAIGVSHIRELAGAIEEKKAGKGVLVTTSWFTPKCHEKAREHGRMELIDGERLKFLIKEHLGKDVLIGIANRPRTRPSTD